MERIIENEFGCAVSHTCRGSLQEANSSINKELKDVINF